MDTYNALLADDNFHDDFVVHLMFENSKTHI